MQTSLSDTIYKKASEGTSYFNEKGLFSDPETAVSLGAFVALLNIFVDEYDAKLFDVSIDQDHNGLDISVSVDCFDSFGRDAIFAQLARASDSIDFLSKKDFVIVVFKLYNMWKAGV